MANWRRYAQLTLLLGTLAALLAGCSLPWQQQQAAQPDLAKDQTLKMVMRFLDPSTGLAMLDPAQALTFDPATFQAASLLFDSLVTLDRKGQIEPWGAQSWAVSPDGLGYTFHLRPNQRFSDGAPVTAADYAWSLDRMANPCVTGDSLGGDYFPSTFLAVVKDAAAFQREGCAAGRPAGALTSLIGDALLPDANGQTLTIRLAQPSGAFLASLATPLAAVLERGAVTGDNLGRDGAWTRHLTDGATGQGGSGMFYLATSASAAYEPGAANVLNKLVFRPNPHWWGQRAGKTPHFSEVEMLRGDLDTFLIDDSIAYVDRVDFQTLQQNPAVRRQPYYHEQPLYWVLTLEFNWKKAPFDDLNARKAFCLAINRAQFNQQVYPGVALPGWHLIPQGMPGYNPALNGVDGAPATGDSALARRSWQAYLAAHPGPAPQVTIVVQSGSSLIPIMNALAQGWRDALGVDASVYVPGMIILPEPASQQVSALNMGLGYADPHYAFPEDYTTRLGVNVAAADALLHQADALAEMSQRIPLYQQAEQLYLDNVAACPLFQRVAAYAQRSWVKGGFVEDGRGVFPNDAWVRGYIAHGQ